MEFYINTGKLFNKSYMIRKRKVKNRYGISKGECFYSLQVGKYGFYLQHSKSRPVGFSKLIDIPRKLIVQRAA